VSDHYILICIKWGKKFTFLAKCYKLSKLQHLFWNVKQVGSERSS